MRLQRELTPLLVPRRINNDDIQSLGWISLEMGPRLVKDIGPVLIWFVDALKRDFIAIDVL
jgi:hypothetical protein